MRSTPEWRLRAAEDPLYAVASHAGREGHKWDSAAFYELGRSDWSDFRQRWESYDPRLSGTCVEIGCGAGRITAPLTASFDTVIGVDVSDTMLELARKAAPTADLRMTADTTLPVDDSTADAVFTCHVLQHFEKRSEVETSLSEAFRVLRPRGTAMIQFIIWQNLEEIIRDQSRHVRLLISRMLQRPGAHTQVRRYSIGVGRSMLERAGFSDVELTQFRTKSNSGVHDFWFARRPAKTLGD